MYLSPQQSQTLFLSLYLSNNNNNDSLLLLFTYVEQKLTVVPNWVIVQKQWPQIYSQIEGREYVRLHQIKFNTAYNA